MSRPADDPRDGTSTRAGNPGRFGVLIERPEARGRTPVRTVAEASSKEA